MSPNNVSAGPAIMEVRGRIDEELRSRAFGLGAASFFGAGLAWLITLVAVVFVPWWAKIPLGFVNGIIIGVLFIVGHDACHGILMPKRWMNRLTGRLCLLPALHPYTAWVHNHNALHHAFTNIKEKDPGFPPLSMEEYRALPAWKRWLYRQHRTWYGMGLLYFNEMWLKWEILPARHRAPKLRKAYQLDRLLVIAFAIVWIGGLIAAAQWRGESAVVMVLTGFVLPYAAWNWLIGFIILQQHTHPRVPWYSELDKPSPTYFQAQVKATPHLTFPAPFRFLMRHVMEHTAHHADPMVPLYRLTDAQKDLEKAYRRDMVRIIWSPRGFMNMLRTCKLYDYTSHRWTDFQGNPTTERLITEIESTSNEPIPAI